MARKSRKGTAAPAAPQKKGMTVWQAALYIRLSVEFNSNRGDSLETQKQIMEAYLALCPDIEIAETYIDNGSTGRTFERPAFQRMLADADEGKINCIVVKDLSRLGRSTIDTGFYIEKYFPLHKIRFIAVNDQYDSEDADNSGSHIIVPLKNMINEAYAADISKKVRAQQHQAMKDGEFVGSRPPYGYLKSPDNCHKLIVDEKSAPIVRLIYQWTADGVPLNVIVKQLNESNILTPGYYMASIGMIDNPHLMGSGKWQTRTVNKILDSAVYTGDMVQGKHTNVGHKQFLTRQEDWVIVRNTHEPIISRELYEQAQAVRKQTARKSSERAAKIPYTENILRGRVFCGFCGKNLHRQKAHGRYYIYHCIANDRIGKGACPGKVYLHEKDLFSAILTIIRQEAEGVIGKSLRLKQQDSKVAAKKAGVDREISKLRQETESNRAFMSSLYENFVTGMLTRAEYLEMKKDYEHKINAAVERVCELQARQSELERQMVQYISLADRLASLDQDTELSAALVNQVIERITVNASNDVSIRFHFESGFERLAEVLSDD